MYQRKYLITGGCGFIGRNLVSKLIENGVQAKQIVIVDNFSVGTPADLNGIVSTTTKNDINQDAVLIIEADIRDAAAMTRHIKDVDYVVHLAACTGVLPAMKDPVFDCDTNVKGTLNVLEACRYSGVKRFVFASSGAPLGMVEPPIHERLPVQPMSPYGASKLAGEGYCSAYYHGFGLETVALRFGGAFGPYSSHKASVVASFISHALKNKPLPLEGGGVATRDFIYTEDIAEAIICACETAGVGGEIFQVSSGNELSIAELTERLIVILEDAGINNVTVSSVPARDVDIERSYSDTTKSKAVLGWSTKYSLEVGLQKTLNWFMEQQG